VSIGHRNFTCVVMWQLNANDACVQLILALRWGVLPYVGYIGMCGPKGYGFSAVLVINRVSILADFGHFGHKQGMDFAL